jgi:hypothetical protein
MEPSSISAAEKIQRVGAGKVMISVYWDCEGVTFVHAMLKGETTLTPTSVCPQNSGSISNESGLT